MNDILRAKLAIMADDELMMRALKRIVDDRITKNKADASKTPDNRILGERVRAEQSAETLIRDVIADIGSFKEKKSFNKQTNKGI